MTFNGKYNLTKVGKDSVHEKCAKKKKKDCILEVKEQRQSCALCIKINRN